MVYGKYAILLIEIDMPPWWNSQFNQELNDFRLRCIVGLIEKVRDVTHIWEFTINRGIPEIQL